jgi:SAM-dependent methyltransferase
MTDVRGAPSYEKDRRYFNRYREGYSPYAPADLDLILGDLLAAIDRKSLSAVCEIGCADGQFSCELARRLEVTRPVRMIGLDIAEQVLRRYPFTRLCASAFEIPLTARSVGLLCYVGSLHHLAPFATALAEVDRIVAPDGLVYFLEPNLLHPQRRLFMSRPALYRLYREANDTPVHPYALREDLARLGFETLVLRFITIAFQKPGLLQRIQNTVAAIPWPSFLHPFVSPWFILLARRRRGR